MPPNGPCHDMQASKHAGAHRCATGSNSDFPTGFGESAPQGACICRMKTYSVPHLDWEPAKTLSPKLRSSPTGISETHASGVLHCGTPLDRYRLAAAMAATGLDGVADRCTKVRDQRGWQPPWNRVEKGLPSVIYNGSSGCWPMPLPVCMVPVPDPTAGHHVSLLSPGPCTSGVTKVDRRRVRQKHMANHPPRPRNRTGACRGKGQLTTRHNAHGQAMRKVHA